MRAVLVAWFLVVASCGDNVRGNVTIVVADASLQPAIGELAALTPYPIIVRPERDDDDDGFVISVLQDTTMPAQSYQLNVQVDGAIVVIAADVLGAQYGTSAALESLGFRFRHPFETFVPGELALVPPDGEIHKPDVRVRGLQLHTLHPIEGYFAFWEPGAGSTNDAHRIIDWVVKNRGNYLQWVALDDILDPGRYVAWRDFTRELIDYAHMRGIRVGINLQLFGASNLQLAFDLVDEADEPVAPQIAARLPLLVDGLPFDVYDLSFGEFFNADPQAFVDAVNEVRNQLRTTAPQAEMHAVIHVGADQLVTFMGETLLYYFLVKFADPSIIPDIHTVMFYDLFEPTGGAYHHEDFTEHREFLLDRMCSGRPVAYFPETAYWVAFDNSVPQYFPLYVRNRWLDLEQLDAQPGCGSLDNHLLFSSGWEWGFWLHDVTALRASYERPASPDDLIVAEMADMPNAPPVIARLIEAQRTHLMLGKLVQYVAGRDAAMDAGRTVGIVSQPDRVVFDDFVMGVADPAAFDTTVMQPLAVYADELDAIAADLDAADLPSNRWGRELHDGIAIDRVRARFVLATYGATLAHLAGDETAARAELARADTLLAQGQAIVLERHGDLHDTHGRRLLDKVTNRTFYQYGYLNNADSLCFWKRELVQVGGILGSTSAIPPNCLF
ncbi:MAG: hypothetical protein ABI867_05625 [Kofleriaceae bacterium]